MSRPTTLLLLTLAALFLVHCDGSTTTGTTEGTGGGGGTNSTGGTAGGAGTMSTGGTGGASGTFVCGASADMPQDCQVGVELCKIQDSAGPITATCIAIPASCPPADDLCACPDLKPGCDLGDGPGAFTCTKDADGNYVVECPG